MKTDSKLKTLLSNARTCKFALCTSVLTCNKRPVAILRCVLPTFCLVY